MNILYISYWSAAEPLTAATVVPHLNILTSMSEVASVVLVTVERSNQYQSVSGDKITHIPLYVIGNNSNTLKKIFDFIRLPKDLIKVTKEHNIDLIMAKGVLAGALADKIHNKLQIPYVTESFEPHADYMIESGEWTKKSLKYAFLKNWEKRQLRNAHAIITVSENYRNHLKGLFPRINVRMLPCCVDVEEFKFSVSKRLELRKKLSISEDHITGIYVGKFGGIYYNEEAYAIFAEAFRFFKNFYLIILSSHPAVEISDNLRRAGINLSRTSILFAKHSEVPGYLSAADFGMSLIKPAKSKLYCCPVKNGEYFANGLPILLTEGIGDDSGLIEQERAGALFHPSKKNLAQGFKKIELILEDKKHRERIENIAVKYRSIELVRRVYAKLIQSNNGIF